jgi:hypothetical protein
MRKRHVFKDLVQLAAEPSSRAKHLFVLGPEPIRFLRTSKAVARWGLDRFPGVQEAFTKSFGSLDTAISDFVAGDGSAVELIDIGDRWPSLFGSP